MQEPITIDGKNPDEVIGKACIFQCMHCSKTAPSIAFNNHELKTPEGWQAMASGTNQRVGYLCPDCWKEVNKSFSYSITVNGEMVQPPTTITPFKDKDGD